MRFKIHPEAYTREEARNGVIPLKSDFRALFLKETAAALLDAGEEWTDFDAFTAGLSPELKQDYQDGLTLLECFEIAQVQRDVQVKPCRVAGERDYRRISAFIEANAEKGFNASIRRDLVYYGEDSVRARQFNNYEYNFIYEENGQITALLVIGLPAAESASNIVYLLQLVMDETQPAAVCAAQAGALLAQAEQAFAGDAARFRYLYSYDAQDALLDLLKNAGFEKTCTLEKELGGVVDLHIYDRKFGG